MTPEAREANLPESVRLPEGPVAEAAPPEALVYAVRADRRVWEMSGRRVRVHLTPVRGIEALEGDGVPLLRGIEVVGGVGANALLGPRSTRREVMIPGGGLRETILVPDALPGAIVQWCSASPGPPRTIPLRIRLPEGAGDVAVHRAPGVLWLGLPTTGLLLHAPGEDTLPEIFRDGDDWVVRWDLALGSGSVTLLAMAAPEDARWASPSALAGVTAHHRRGEIMARGGGEPGVELETGVADLDQGLQWTRSWLRDRLLTSPGSPPTIHSPGKLAGLGDGLPPESGTRADAPAWLARAATATGDWEAARGALGALGWASPWERLHSALALARYAAWTGDGRPFQAAAEAVRGCFAEPGGLSGIPEPVAVAVWETVKAAAEAVEVTGLQGLPRPSPPPRDRSRQLPVLGAGGPPADIPTPPKEHPWLPYLGFVQEAGAVLRARGALGEVANDPASLGRGVGVVAALELVEGMLGAVPDATFSRLALSPLLPPSWTAFRAKGLRTGEGILQVDYRREGDRATWTLVPREGSVPLTAIFRPWLPWGRLASVRVDDQEAALDVEPVGGWSRLQVQIPVDGEHTVEVTGEGPRAESLPGAL